MAHNKFPPRGYKTMDYPLPHNFGYGISLGGDSATRNSTIFTILRASEIATGVEAIEVNPANSAFAEDQGPLIHMGSIIPRINFTLMAQMSKVAIETDKQRATRFNWMPIYIAFLDTLEAEDSKTSTQVEDTLELQHETTNKDTYPLFNGTKLTGDGGYQAFSTVPSTEVFGDYGLTTNGIMEGVDFVMEEFYDNLQFKTNHGMLQKTIGQMRTVVVKRDHPYIYHSNSFTYPSVKRGNPYTFCGVLVHVEQVGTPPQIGISSELTDIDHLNVKCVIRYDEWNTGFDQAVV